MASNCIELHGFEIVKRVDGQFNVWDMGWWPDPELDDYPDRLTRWLEGTEGWRAKGWQVVHVAPTLPLARMWANQNRSI